MSSYQDSLTLAHSVLSLPFSSLYMIMSTVSMCVMVMCVL